MYTSHIWRVQFLHYAFSQKYIFTQALRYNGLTLRANDHEFEDGSRFPESQSREEMHSLVLGLLKEGMDPAVVTSHVPQGREMTGHGRYHT